MEPTQPPVASVPPEAPAAEPKTSYATLIALVVIVLLIAGGAMYFLKARIAGVDTMRADPSALTEQSESTEPEAIESDLSAESPDEFDAELEAAFDELDASFAE